MKKIKIFIPGIQKIEERGFRFKYKYLTDGVVSANGPEYRHNINRIK